MSEIRGVEILYVEDNPSDVELTLRTFKELNMGNQVHVVRDGAEALDFLFGEGAESGPGHSDAPRLVLLDLKLPKVDGIEVLKAIRADERTKMIPVVVLTSSKAESDLIKSYELGVNSYIVKPVDFDQFNDAVRMIGKYWLLVNQPPKLGQPGPDA